MSVLNDIFLILSSIAGLLLVIGIIKPKSFDRPGKPAKRLTKSPRLDNIVIFGGFFLLFGFLAGATAPSLPNDQTAPKSNKVATHQNKPEKKTISNNQSQATVQPPAPKPQPAQIVLTGYGATQDEWNKTHKQVQGFAANSTYDPEPGSAGGCNGVKYCTVEWLNNRAYSYEISLPNHFTQAVAQIAVMQEFPTGTKVLWQGKQTASAPDVCYEMEVRNNALKVLGGDGDAFVEFSTFVPSDNSGYTLYYPSNVNSIIVNNTDYKSLSDAGTC